MYCFSPFQRKVHCNDVLGSPNFFEGGNSPMAIKKAKATDKALTKAATLTVLAEETGLTKKDVANLLDVLANLAYAQAPAGFTLPGLGKLKLVQRAARTGRNPATGEAIKIPAKKVLKFTIAKAAKDAVCPVKK
jgi:DNA-binding protein HU-beta